MALEGNISEFSLPEILQLLSSQRKTGVLQLEQEGDSAAFDFEEGKITGGFYRRKDRQEFLGGYLFKTGLITESALAQAEAQQERLNIPLEEVLIEKGFISEEDFTEVIRFKIQEIMDEVFIWVEGHYTFDLKTRLYTQSKYPVKLDTDGFLLEGMRRLDEWMRIRVLIPSSETMVHLKPGFRPEGLNPEQEKVLEFLGSRHLAAGKLVEISGLGKFITCQTIVELAEMGAINIIQTRPEPAKSGVQGFNAATQASVISLMLNHLGSLIRRLSIYPFNNPRVLSALEEFFYLFNGLGLAEEGLSIIPGLDGARINGQLIDPRHDLITQFGLYLSQRQIEKLELLPQLKSDELRTFAYLLAMPSDLVQMLDGPAALIKGHHLPHIRIEHSRQRLEPLMQSERVFVIPSRFMELLDDQDNEAIRQKDSRHLFESLKQVIQFPAPPLAPEDSLKLEEAENSAEKAFGVYSRGGREKYIEKTVQVLMRLPPAARLAFLKRKVNDVRWLFQLDNVAAISRDQFDRIFAGPKKK
ncbi:MAG: hypothetical protein A2509_02735 [Candidatus Edwardsbacteria bacterium RIFOXYD12_FULL_50_11]|jgi:hypothetical protein|uniref:PatA-like N-terminal domain-containing protein n=1 Tax=Candidatus Edwardsbacteria bacterium GWF2_54_11 TaxID=1817851 RepID=A0A1F5RI71_9BACT|nr:MAG: hypothetical protein A2502_06600 [Candidatus Edwardsbacteria bacterium RifOxyC12_full_54_24]OGF07034.1 MAG: hypothetical protein A2273_08830 [Candidatus Edwardsbacteria bacterium RifOxyA12_full_54_48]OGF11000.1 MAG: hypothetical protein A3K15_07680 [Candidatus Edwardsbacteria bacterium GWE2_54_12]OGF14098.1 MAG: hypothetical protein A2024_06095 [Candidatus Edwardsbacteria bacterium GWF2_54_11]OGF15946.1 MAG: hypothetical protein A2509_02735 [Candidatus Edwardsbacteria bacterium RIFOXYD1